MECEICDCVCGNGVTKWACWELNCVHHCGNSGVSGLKAGGAPGEEKWSEIITLAASRRAQSTA